jgi:hypothetical protein
MYTVMAEEELPAAFTKAHDDLFYKATGLSDFGDNAGELDQNALENFTARKWRGRFLMENFSPRGLH